MRGIGYNHTFATSREIRPPCALFRCPCGHYLAESRRAHYGASVKVCGRCSSWHSILFVDPETYGQLVL